MKKLLALLLVALFAFAFEKSTQHPQLLQEGPAKMWCSVCGMNLAKFYRTNHAVVLKDGSKKQFCSMHCLAALYPQIKDKIKEILVVDAKSGKFIPVGYAWYVVGSKVPGTMSKVSKIAFGSKEEALAFAKEYGGEVMRFDEAFAKQLELLQKENAMLERKKRKKIYPIGERIYKKRCKSDLNKSTFATVADLKSYLASSKVCGDLRGKKLQALTLYIWEAKDKKRILVPKDAKCPVCGMFVAKYPRWAAMIVDKDGHKYYFDGVKDMMRYILAGHEPKRAYVSDYYSGDVLEAKSAYYVIGSDVLGPMGKELIPFKTRSMAARFLQDHGGKRILRFDQIDKEVLKELE
ncbi:MAG: nitrous oxide reductase [Epsilonproteobacteria bacterium]|nr:nitrous oxide reductase [Campylobacterota bacterium]NPA65171.1 nitrous oxide reductase [Campylobacterota bacterium]